VVAFTEFAGGAMRPVYEDSDGLQYVHDDDGSVVRGNCWMPRDLPEPLIVEATD
jgi:hypothetical protein